MALPDATPPADEPPDLGAGGAPGFGPSGTQGGYAAFSGAVLAWFGCWGMQGVLFSWLIVGELGAPAEWVGAAHFSLVIPGLVFLLIGGATADRVDRRRLLIGLHGVAAGIIAGLAAIVGLGWLSFPVLVGYALLMGTVSAFVLPARDALLTDVAGRNMMRAVVGVTLIQFTAQAAGALGAGAARFVGSPAMLAVQAGVVLAGVIAVRRLPRVHHEPLPEREPIRASELLTGVREVLGSPALRPVLLLTLGVGFFFQGPYWVVYPLLIRDYYHGTVDQLGMLTATFPVGTMLGSVVLLRRGYVRRRGRALALAQAIAALCLIVLSLGVPFEVALVAGFAWGLCGGVFLNTGRTVFQERAPAAHRARVLSVYPLCFFAAGSLGSPLSGVLAGWLGPLGAFAFCGAAMLVFVAAIVLWTDALRLE